LTKVNKLILIRHSQSQVDPDSPAHEWPLSEEGRRRCAPLAQRLAVYAPEVIVASRERKAAETATRVAATLGVRLETALGLHEHERARAPFTSAEVFERTVATFFERPDDLVFGEETAAQARERFDRAVQGVLALHPGKNVAIVSHGTVMTLFVAQHAGVAPFPFWKRLGMPALVMLSLPDFGLLEVIERLEIGD
jgi:broad specificity phosphatase PhoE